MACFVLSEKYPRVVGRQRRPDPASYAQTSGQLWVDVVLEKPRTHRLVFNLDLEPKVLVYAPGNNPVW
jgi:hypothetical protein